MKSLAKIILFGEAERGDYCLPYHCSTLTELIDLLGQAPPHSHGIHYAVQALLYRRELLYFRVQEEGYSYQDYLRAVKMIATQSKDWGPFSAVCAPGVAEDFLLRAIDSLCRAHRCLLITNEADLFDYLMEWHRQL